MSVALSHRREKFLRLVAAANDQTTDWLIASLRDPRLIDTPDHCRMTRLSRLACLRVLASRDGSGQPYPARKRFVREMLSGEKQQAALIKLRLTVEVTYYLNGTSATEMVWLLRKMCAQAIGEGMLTGQTDAEVDEYSIDAAILPEPLSEDELTSFMQQRIECGDLPLEDIPIRLARYGLMEPSAFIVEMRERMKRSKQGA
jgi:hypothetical protein